MKSNRTVIQVPLNTQEVEMLRDILKRLGVENNAEAFRFLLHVEHTRKNNLRYPTPADWSTVARNGHPKPEKWQPKPK